VVVDQYKLVYHGNWVAKVLQLYDTTLVRHGIMLVGPAGGDVTLLRHTIRLNDFSLKEEKPKYSNAFVRH
jgi:dynein heavy chain